MSEMKTMIVASTVLLAVGYLVMWYLGLFEGMGLHGTIAAVIGVALTTALGVGLMALLFYSDRAKHDQQHHDAWKERGKKD